MKNTTKNTTANTVIALSTLATITALGVIGSHALHGDETAQAYLVIMGLALWIILMIWAMAYKYNSQ